MERSSQRDNGGETKVSWLRREEQEDYERREVLKGLVVSKHDAGQFVGLPKPCA